MCGSGNFFNSYRFIGPREVSNLDDSRRNKLVGGWDVVFTGNAGNENNNSATATDGTHLDA